MDDKIISFLSKQILRMSKEWEERFGSHMASQVYITISDDFNSIIYRGVVGKDSVKVVDYKLV